MVVSLLGESEQLVWEHTLRTNQRAVGTDGALIKNMLAIAAARLLEVNEELQRLTSGTVETAHQRERIQAFVAKEGYPLEDLQAATVERALEDPALPSNIRQVLALRLEAAHGLKVESLLACRRLDGGIPDTLIYHGAGPGRFTSRTPQLQNLQREGDNTLGKVAAIMTGSLEAVRAFGPIKGARLL
jgi:DNA polymerase